MNSIGIIFVGGCPRSGTSLVQKILNNHSKIYGGPEFDHLPSIIRLYDELNSGIENGRQAMFYNKEDVQDVIRGLINKLLLKRKKDQNLFVSEKTPDNIFVFDQLYTIFPQEKYIIIVRDPRAILYSFEKVHKKAKELKIDLLGFGSNLFIDIYRINKSLGHIDKIIRNFGDKCFLLYYEDLVEYSHHIVTNLCKFLDLPFEEQMLKTSTVGDSNKLFENPTIQPFITDSFSADVNTKSLKEWNHKMTNSKIVICTSYFRNKKYNILSRYKFESYSFFLPIYLIYYFIMGFIFGIKILFTNPKKIIKYVAKNY